MTFFSTLAGMYGEHWRELLNGLWLALALVAASCGLGFLAALPISLACSSENGWLRWPAQAFSVVFRGSPLYVQVFLVYFGLPAALLELYGGNVGALRQSMWWPLLSSPFLLVLVAFTLNNAAYMAEDLRGGLQSVPRGLQEAALAQGMGYWPIQRRIVLPLAFRQALPSLFNEVIFTFKATAIASTVTLLDLMGVGNRIFSRTYDVTAYIAIAVIYLIVVAIMARLFGYLERHLSRHLPGRA